MTKVAHTGTANFTAEKVMTSSKREIFHEKGGRKQY